MPITISINSEEQKTHDTSNQPLWQRLTLLTVLGYEAAGCLTGGALLVAAPDGRYMQMPVELMNGVFADFLVPGIILFGLGILNTFAFISVIRRTSSDWLLAGLGMGGLLVWFVTEIIILQELHWLHLMWGLPVLLGWLVTIPLIALRHETKTIQRLLLTCGILSSLWYIAINIWVPLLDPAYNSVTTTVSELSAIGAPTRITWVLLAIFYVLLFMSFGWGVLKTAGNNTKLKITGSLVLVYSIMNFYWPPMHHRDIIGAGQGTLTDTMHIVWAMTTLAFMIALMAFGAAALGKRFRYFTAAIFVVFLVFGILTGIESPGIDNNLPTPHLGLWERINIGVFMIWVIVFAGALLKKKNQQPEINIRIN